MSGTVGMLTKLAEFNAKNTQTFYPDLYKLKLQTLNAGKKTRSNFVYTYNATAAGAGATSEYLKMLVEFRRLFPDIVFFCTKTHSETAPSTSSFFTYPLSGTVTPTSLSITSGNKFYISVVQDNTLTDSSTIIGLGGTSWA
jgi:hypothetical protein